MNSLLHFSFSHPTTQLKVLKFKVLKLAVLKLKVLPLPQAVARELSTCNVMNLRTASFRINRDEQIVPLAAHQEDHHLLFFDLRRGPRVVVQSFHDLMVHFLDHIAPLKACGFCGTARFNMVDDHTGGPARDIELPHCRLVQRLNAQGREHVIRKLRAGLLRSRRGLLPRQHLIGRPLGDFHRYLLFLALIRAGERLRSFLYWLSSCFYSSKYSTPLGATGRR
jgi:hypothetical protein